MDEPLEEESPIPPPTPLKVMVCSAVYGNENLLDQVFAVLRGYGYEVWMSHKGTLPLLPGRHNFESCLAAVSACDVVLALVTGSYGSGKMPGEPSITHQEVRRAIQENKPRFFLVHHHITIARQLLQQFRFDEAGARRAITWKRTAILDDLRVLDMLDEALQMGVPFEQRTDHWTQDYTTPDDVLRFLHTQFRDPQRLRALLQNDPSIHQHQEEKNPNDSF